MTLTPAQRRCLDEDGFLLLEGAAGDDLIAALRRRIEELFAREGEQAGAEFKQEPECRRLANLVDKGRVFREVIVHRAALGAVEYVLGPELKLSSLNVRSVNAHSSRGQPLHADMGAVADDTGYWVANVVWLLDDYTEEKGGLRVVPGSHRWGALPQDVLEDPFASHDQEVVVTAPAGSLLVLNAHVWHAGTPNRTGRPRTALHAFYCRRDKPQQQYQKKLLCPETLEQLDSEVRWLLALDDPLNDRISAAATRRSGFLR